MMRHSLTHLHTFLTQGKWRWLAGAAAILFLVIAWPPPASLLHPTLQAPVQILDRNGVLLSELRPKESGSRQDLALQEMPQSLLDAVISIEDRDFYHHGGISLKAIARAAFQNISAQDIVSGGSTITQQLVRNRLQPKQRTFLYKIIEAYWALKLGWYESKDAILSAYLNSAYFGHQAYGINAAAHAYFGVNPSELSIGQSALLAGLLQSPAYLDPFQNPTEARARQKRVLQAMLDTKTITDAQYADALHEPMSLTSDSVSIQAPHFVFWLADKHPEIATAKEPVRTTLDANMQADIERIIDRNLTLLKNKNVTSAAVVVLDAHTGDIRAMVGSANYFDADHAGAVNSAIALRQPGSALKPFTYALALNAGDTAATTVSDTETQFFTQDGNPYTPRNYDFGFHGLVRYREALANSYNIAAVKVLQKVGVAALMGILKEAGITSLTDTPEHYGLALTLGDAEVSLLELTRAYGMFARGGITLNDRALLSDPVILGTHILDPKIAWLITSILSDNSARLPEFGEDSALAFPFPVAAKTGTTRNSRDNWTIGYTPDVVVGVWVGNADNSPMQGTSGVTGAGPIFHDTMLRAVQDFPSHDFVMPTGIHEETICRLSGEKPTPLCPQTMQEYFINGTEPKIADTMFQNISIDMRNNLLANDTCPAAFVMKKVFAIFPKDTQQWARENGWPTPPTAESPLCSPSTTQAKDQWIEITSPHTGDTFTLDPLIPDTKEQVILSAEASANVQSIDWYVNNNKIATAHQPDFRTSWQPIVGHAHIEARSNELSDHVDVDVEKGE